MSSTIGKTHHKPHKTYRTQYIKDGKVLHAVNPTYNLMLAARTFGGPLGSTWSFDVEIIQCTDSYVIAKGVLNYLHDNGNQSVNYTAGFSVDEIGSMQTRLMQRCFRLIGFNSNLYLEDDRELITEDHKTASIKILTDLASCTSKDQALAYASLNLSKLDDRVKSFYNSHIELLFPND